MSPRRLRLVIGWIEVFGAALGTPVSYQLFSAGVLSFAAAFTLFFTLLGVAGVLLVRNRPWGVPLSLLVQGMQVPVFLSSGPSYYASSGLGLFLTMDFNWDGSFYTFLGTLLHYSWQSDRTTTAVGVNVVAAVLLYLLMARVEEPIPARPLENRAA